MIGLVAWLVRSTLGDSLFAVRLLPAIAHAATVALAARLAREMGGGRYAQFAAALATALAPAYVGICGSLSMNAFDILFWAALWLISARALRSENPRMWLWFGFVAGLLFLPHLLWQWQNGWPTLEFMANAARGKNVSLPPAEYLVQQVIYMNAPAAPLWIVGLAGLLAARRFRALH